jgi:hypothetical protein
MKHLQTFESFENNLNTNEDVNEGVLRKFFTGHETKADEKAAEAAFMKALDEAEAELKKNPKDYFQSKNWPESRAYLMGQAAANRFRGGLRVQRGGATDAMFIVYDAKASGFESAAGGAAGSVKINR